MPLAFARASGGAESVGPARTRRARPLPTIPPSAPSRTVWPLP